MNIQLFSIHHAPVSLPIWHTILDDLGRPHPRHVARVLGVGVRTVYRWNSDGQAPRAAALALFWLTRWGRSQVHCQAVNDATMAVGLVDCLNREIKTLRVQLDHVLALADTGAANSPYIGR
jgi:predicted DNA-binding transcriptional regulator AlpA